MVDWFVKEASNYKPSKVRELPEWALKIFSPGMVAASNITTEKELNPIIIFYPPLKALLYNHPKI